jgi:hypothetical protein
MIDESMRIAALVENKNEDWNVAGWLVGWSMPKMVSNAAAMCRENVHLFTFVYL